MLREETKKHIAGLSNVELIEYVMTGERMYQPEALAFAAEELDRRKLDPVEAATVRPEILRKLAAHDEAMSKDMIQPRAEPILCQRCGYEVPTRYFEYGQNIGLFVVRLHTRYRGNMCKSCSFRVFAKATGITLLLGWWGFISLFVAGFDIVRNSCLAMVTLFMPGAPLGARRPELTGDVLGKIDPHVALITEKLSLGTSIFDVSREMAVIASVTPGEMYCFIRSSLEPSPPRQRPEAPAKTYGFPVELEERTSVGI